MTHHTEGEQATSPEQVIEIMRGLMHRSDHHAAHNVAADYLMTHEIDEQLLDALSALVRIASRFDRNLGIQPENMLWECEESARILQRRIPDMSSLTHRKDDDSRRLFRCVKIVYETWCYNAAALVEYRYRVSNDSWMRRSWIEPRDLGFLLDIMRTAVQSKLPLDLLRVAFNGVRHSIVLASNAIAFDHTRGKFIGDCLRITASAVKDIVPDMQMEIYRDIVRSYLHAGDAVNAEIFINQGLLLNRSDRVMNELKHEVLELKAHGQERKGMTSSKAAFAANKRH